MPSDRLVLAFDTSAAHVAAALLSGDQIIAAKSEDLARGQAERLIPMLEEVLAEGGVTLRDLAAMGVGVGPGNFTGIRISVSAARGLALGLDIPARGISTFEAISLDQTSAHIPTVPAPREQLYVAQPDTAPALMLQAEAEALGLPLVARPHPAKLVENIARAAASGLGSTPPAPLYVRAADAAPPRDPAPTILPS